MEKNGFKIAGDLNDDGMSYFQRGGSLEEPMKSGESSFKPAGDLKSINTNTAFKFEEKNHVLKTSDDIRKLLKTIVSGKKMSDERLMATGGGQMFVTVDKLDEMIENGDNIIKAEYFENTNMILIEFESFGLNNNMKCR